MKSYLQPPDGHLFSHIQNPFASKLETEEIQNSRWEGHGNDVAGRYGKDHEICVFQRLEACI